jgi:hypothetical protein
VSFVLGNPVNAIDPSGNKELICEYQDSNCIDMGELEYEYNNATLWKEVGLSFDDFVVGKVSHDYYMDHPQEALQAAIDDTDTYRWADMYSEYVLRKMFQPFDEGAVMVMAEQAKAANNGQTFWGLMLWMATGLFFEPDRSFGGGFSTGRTIPKNITEQRAMEKAMANPELGLDLHINLNDPRWPSSKGWVKMAQNIDGVEIHYVYNKVTGEVADFKFK